MTLPAGITTVTVTGTVLSPAGTPAKGSIQFTPTVGVLYVGQDVVTVPNPVTVFLGPGGLFTVDLPATDDTAGNPVDWTYHVSERIGKGSRDFYIALPTVPTEADYSDLVPVPSNDGTPIVKGPKGDPGWGILYVDNGDGTFTLTTADGSILVDNGDGTFTLTLAV